MPEALPPTLIELRNAVLIRAGMNITDGSAGQYFPLIDELLRKSQKELHLEAPWLRNYVRVTQATTPGNSDYDLPDDCLFSDMGRVSVGNLDGKQYPLRYGDGAIRNVTSYANSSSFPLYYEIQDQVLRIYPTPDTNWVTLIYEYHKGATQLVAETDRTNIDGEAMVQRTTYYLKRQTGFGGDWKPEREEHMRYLNRLREEQGVVRAIDMRGSLRGRYDRYVGNGAPYTSTWAPWY